MSICYYESRTSLTVPRYQTQSGDWSGHQIEHELGGMFDVAHGAGLIGGFQKLTMEDIESVK